MKRESGDGAHGRGARIGAHALAKVYLPAATHASTSPVTVFENVDLEIAPGERVAIVGQSGSGKSTLLHLLGGLDQPSRGSVSYDGADLYSRPPAEIARFRNREIGYVWQQSSLLPEFTAEENVMMPLLIRGESADSARGAALEMLDRVGLRNRAGHRSGELSGGEQQRVSVARALVAKPRTLLADEPTGSLDYKTGDSIAFLLGELHEALGFTAVVVTHNLGFARAFDRVLQLEKGNFRSWEAAGPNAA